MDTPSSPATGADATTIDTHTNGSDEDAHSLLSGGVKCVRQELIDHDIPVIADSESESDGHDPSSETDPDYHDTARTVPPMHVEEDRLNEQARIVVLETCSLLLSSVESIKMSLLQLQYSLHAGDLGVSTAIATKPPSRKIWAWDSPAPLDGRGAAETSVFDVDVFDPSNITDELKLLPHGVYDVFDGGCITTVDTEPVLANAPHDESVAAETDDATNRL